MKKKRVIGIVLVLAMILSSMTTFLNVDFNGAASRAKLKSVKAVLKTGRNVQKKGNTFYIVKGTKAKIAVTPILSKKVKAKTTKSFKTSNKKVMTVSKSGVINAKKEGKAQIKITLKTKKTKKVSKGKKSKKIYVVSLSRSKFNKMFFTAEPAKPDPGYPAYYNSNNNNNNNNSNNNNNNNNSQTKTMQQILDEMTDSNGTLTLTVSFLKEHGYVDWHTYSVPTEFTKAKKVKLPELPDLQWDKWASKTLRTDVVYSVPNSFNCTWNYMDDIYDCDTRQSDNQLNIATIEEYYNWDKKGTFIGSPSLRPTFLGWDGGVTRFKIQNASTKAWKIFQFEVYNPDYNAEYYRMYVEMKKISKEALKNCTTDMEKVRKIIDLVRLNRIGNVKTYTYSCGTYATYLERYCNLNGIPCTQREAGYDMSYGQTPNHINNLILIDGQPYIVDAKYGDFIKYSLYCDKNCCYLDFTNACDKNFKGKVDINLSRHGGTAYQDILRKAGYNAILHDHDHYDGYYK